MVTESPLLPRPTRHFQRRKTQLSSSPLFTTTTPSRFPNLQRPNLSLNLSTPSTWTSPNKTFALHLGF
ncbi:hypothetical protein BN1708_000813 [Verticillium longisporum]|uniref:Uncharacterized protein n=1 Tax=Verticillium longisporum TaxID=100787 RepID=A0A0G4M7M7_VERLO|nr:hypothetical protein BN1708_000813 [Verticillium longisporum]